MFLKSELFLYFKDTKPDQKSEQLIKRIYLSISSAQFGTIFAFLFENTSFLKEMVTKLRTIVSYTHYNSQELDRNFDCLLVNNKLTTCYAKSIIGDGNCFYRSISYLLFGTQELFFILKVLCIFILIEYEKYFENILKLNVKKITITEFIVNVASTDAWADETIMIATTILLNRTLFSFSMDQKSHKPSRLRFTMAANETNPLMRHTHEFQTN